MHGIPRLTSGHALFLDFDGTLVDIAPQPDAVRVEPDMVDVLAHLSKQLQGAIAIVSGRTLEEIDRFLAPLALTVASEHGAQCRVSGAPRSLEAPFREPTPASLEIARSRLQSALQPYPDLLLETKTNGLALHYRHAPSLAPLCERLMQKLMRELPGMELLHGKYVVELKPAGASKGKATQDLMQQAPFQGRTPLFIGDDVTDESAFLAVQRMGGIGIKVGPEASQAQARCDSPAHLREWLRQQMLTPLAQAQRAQNMQGVQNTQAPG